MSILYEMIYQNMGKNMLQMIGLQNGMLFQIFLKAVNKMYSGDRGIDMSMLATQRRALVKHPCPFLPSFLLTCQEHMAMEASSGGKIAARFM